MNKTLKINIICRNKNGFNPYIKDSFGELALSSKKVLEEFIKTPFNVINVEEKMQEAVEGVIVDLDFDNQVSGKIKSEEERHIIIKKVIDNNKLFYNKILNGEYKFVELKEYDKIPYTSFKAIVKMVKDKVEVIDLSSLSFDELKDLITTVDISDKVKIKTKYNYRDECTRSELIELIKYLDTIINYVKRFDLTPLEICIFVNDLLKEREWLKSNEQKSFKDVNNKKEFEETFKSFSDSRSLFKVYKKESIVCVGFSNLYSAVLDLCGINTELMLYQPITGNVGHATNIVYLNDPVYSASGIFEVDTTWGRHFDKDKKYDYTKSVNNYSNFCLSLEDAINYKKSHGLTSDSVEACTHGEIGNIDIDRFISRYKRLEKLMDLGAPFVIVGNEIKMLYEAVEVIYAKYKSEDLKETITRLKRLYTSIQKNRSYSKDKVFDVVYDSNYYILKSELDENDFKSALLKVKLIEHSIDKDKYPLNQEIYDESVSTRFTRGEFMERILGSITKQLSEEEKLKIARMELLSTLRKISNDSTRENPLQYKKK